MPGSTLACTASPPSPVPPAKASTRRVCTPSPVACSSKAAELESCRGTTRTACRSGLRRANPGLSSSSSTTSSPASGTASGAQPRLQPRAGLQPQPHQQRHLLTQPDPLRESALQETPLRNRLQRRRPLAPRNGLGRAPAANAKRARRRGPAAAPCPASPVSVGSCSPTTTKVSVTGSTPSPARVIR